MKLNVITSNEYLAEIIIKNDIEQLLIKYKHENNIDEQRNCKTNKPHKFVRNVSRRSNKHVVLQNLSTY